MTQLSDFDSIAAHDANLLLVNYSNDGANGHTVGDNAAANTLAVKQGLNL